MLVLLFLIGISLANIADTLTGEARGTVVDIVARNPIENTTMTLTNADRGWSRQVSSDLSGNYVFIQLEPGNYSVVAEKEGYYTSERTDVLVRLNQPKVVIPPFELRSLVASPTQQITVQGEQARVALIDLTAPGPAPTILAFINEPGFTALASTLDWTLRYNFDSQILDLLPMRGSRTFDQLSLLSPGVFRVPFSSGSGPAVGNGVGSTGQFSVNGMRSRSNNFTVDGSDNNDEDIGVRRQGFVALVPQTLESVQEFQIVTAGFPAEFGRNTGSMVNVVSRSGQQDVHGSVYGFYTDDGLAAGNYFDHSFEDRINTGGLNGGRYGGKDFDHYQLGGVLGGPILPERVYYFLSAEKQKSRGTALGNFVVPSVEERGLRTVNGTVPVAELGRFLDERGIPYSDQAGKGVFSLYPLPNDPAGPFGANNYAAGRPYTGDGLILSGRVDWYLSSTHTFTGRYNFTDDESVIPFTGDAINSSIGTATRTQNVSMFLNTSTANYGNMIRFSYGRTHLRFPAEDGDPLLFGSLPTPDWPTEFGNSIDTGYGRFGPFGATGPIGQLQILPYSMVGIDVFNFPQGRVDNTFQISDAVTWTGGRHTTKFGFDIRRSQLNSFSDRNSRPLVVFGSGTVSSGCMANPLCPFATPSGRLEGTDLAALGAPAGFLQTISTNPAADTTIGLRFSQFDFFLQTDIRLRSNLNLNIGARYELQTVPREVNSRIEDTFGVRPDQFNHLEPTGSARDRVIIQAGNTAFDQAVVALGELTAGRGQIYDSNANNIGPRIGFAWDPVGDGRMLVRGGYSLQFDANLGAFTSQSRNVFPTFAPLNLDLNFRPPNGQFLNSPVFFSFLPTDEPLITPGTLNAYNLTGDSFATGLGTLFLQAPPIPGASLSGNGLAFRLPERDLDSSYAQHFVASVEKQFGQHWLVSLSYVGTRGKNLSRFTSPNGGLISTPVLLSSPTLPLTILDLPPTVGSTVGGRPVSGLGAFDILENSATSDYHSLQISAEKRLSRGIQFRSNWTWSHAIDEVSDPFSSRGFYYLPQDLSDLGAERASANFDVRHRVSGFLIWDIPGSGRFLENWTLAAVAELQGGQPFTVNTSIDRNHDGNLTDRLDTMAGLAMNPEKAEAINLDPTISTLDLIANSGGAGRVGRNSFRADGLATLDTAVSRSFTLGDTRALDLRIEIFNIFNNTSFGIPIRVLESPGFGRAFDTQTDARRMKLSLKLKF